MQLNQGHSIEKRGVIFTERRLEKGEDGPGQRWRVKRAVCHLKKEIAWDFCIESEQNAVGKKLDKKKKKTQGGGEGNDKKVKEIGENS